MILAMIASCQGNNTLNIICVLLKNYILKKKQKNDSLFKCKPRFIILPSHLTHHIPGQADKSDTHFSACCRSDTLLFS